MPFISRTSKKQVENQYNAIVKLHEKCESCKVFQGQTANEIYTYNVCGSYSTADGPAMVAIALYSDSNGNNTYAIHAPEYLSKEQYVVIEFLLRDIKPDDKIVVFSLECYHALGKYSYGKPLNVQLYV